MDNLSNDENGGLTNGVHFHSSARLKNPSKSTTLRHSRNGTPSRSPSSHSTSNESSSSSRPSISVLQNTPAPRPPSLQHVRPQSPLGKYRALAPSIIGGESMDTARGQSSFVGTVHSHAAFRPLTRRERTKLFITQTFSLVISCLFLSMVVLWAFAHRVKHELPKWLRGDTGRVYAWDRPEFLGKEKLTQDIGYYARSVGYDIVDEEVETKDGYFLKMHRVVNPRHKIGPDGRGPYPVLILHGLFQSSGSFITSEERSLAFWLSEKGYQVFLGNTRAVFDMGHRHYKRNDPRFWDWTIEELAKYDLPALIDWVCLTTGYDKIAYIGHSQGNGLAFLSLSQGFVPEIGEKISVFIALAPAVFAGPLTRGFPFTTLHKMDWHHWKKIFGVLDFIPVMTWAYNYVPAPIFSSMGYTMFAFLFAWTDANWLKRRKNKMFRFTPTPVSSAGIFWWCGKGGFADRQCTMDVGMDHWWDEHFPPLSIYYGGCDYLVLTEPLLERIEKQEKTVNLIRVKKLDLAEHCDFYWAAEAVEWCFNDIVEDIERTRPKPQNDPPHQDYTQLIEV